MQSDRITIKIHIDDVKAPCISFPRGYDNFNNSDIVDIKGSIVIGIGNETLENDSPILNIMEIIEFFHGVLGGRDDRVTLYVDMEPVMYAWKDQDNVILTRFPSRDSVFHGHLNIVGNMHYIDIAEALGKAYDELKVLIRRDPILVWLYSWKNVFIFPKTLVKYKAVDYDVLGEVTAIRENGATSGTGVLATFAYDDMGRRTSLTRGNGLVDSYSYDTAGRLATLANNHATAGNSYGYAYNPAGQLTSRTMSNDAYSWTGAVAINRSYTVNGLNQYTASGSITPTYDGRGNLTSAGQLAEPDFDL